MAEFYSLNFFNSEPEEELFTSYDLTAWDQASDAPTFEQGDAHSYSGPSYDILGPSLALQTSSHSPPVDPRASEYDMRAFRRDAVMKSKSKPSKKLTKAIKRLKEKTPNRKKFREVLDLLEPFKADGTRAEMEAAVKQLYNVLRHRPKGKSTPPFLSKI